MTVSYNWLKDYLSFDLQPEEVGRILTATGLEVEHMETAEQIPGGLAGVVVAEVVECTDHPDSDHLHITKLNIGEGELLQVVCGAPNVAAGQKVMLATVGTKLVASNGEEIKLKKSKIRGVESFGMICAEDELGIGEDHSGIMVLDPSAVPGTSAKEFLHLKSDTCYEIGLTPNRIDGASHIGAARDLYAYCRLNNIPVEWKLPNVDAFKEGEGNAIPVEVLATEDAPRYIGITFKNVKVGPSPEWLKERLNAIGQRPINNMVDITNFLLNEMCQPLHAFDASKIEGKKVIVRRSDDGAKFVTLDGVERTLTSNDLVICNSKEPMCIAGVFGGEKSGITEETTDVFLEIAYFNPVTIRKTSKRLGIKTDASFRYERGIDEGNTMYAAKRAALLIRELTGGEILGKVQEFYPEPVKKAKVDLDFSRMEALMGKAIGAETIKNILKYLEFEIVSENGGGCTVLVPTYRVDVTRECDVVEEVLRIYGYNNIELPTSMRVSINSTEYPDPEVVHTEVSNLLSHNGFVETMNNSLTKSSYYENLTTYPETNLVRLLNPLSSDLNVMRQTLILNGLEMVAYNIHRQSNDLKLYEIGNVYSYNPVEGEIPSSSNLKSYGEHQSLGIFISGPGSKAWRNENCGGHYFALKGYVELLLRRFGMNCYDLECGAAPSDLFAEGIEYKLQGRSLALLGTVSSQLLKMFDIKQPVFAAEINWPVFFEIVKRDKVKFKPLPKYPEVHRDLALLLDDSVSYADLRKAAFKAEKGILKQVSLFDVYKGDKIPAGKKQYAVSFTLQNPDKTLTDNDVENAMKTLFNTFEKQFSATLR